MEMSATQKKKEEAKLHMAQLGEKRGKEAQEARNTAETTAE